MMKCGHYWSRTCQVSVDNGVELHRIIDVLSTPCFVCYEPVLLGVTYRRIMENGVQFINVLSVGAEKVFGKNCWKR